MNHIPEQLPNPSEFFFRVFSDDHSDEDYMHYVDGKGHITSSRNALSLNNRAKEIGSFLKKKYGVKKGDRVLLACSPSLEFVEGVIACFFLGAIPVPVPPPDPRKSNNVIDKIAKDSGAKLILTNKEYNTLRKIGKLTSIISTLNFKKTEKVDLEWVVIDKIKSSPLTKIDHPIGEDICFIQYTSGSTSDPKGVIVTWNNLVHQMVFTRPIAKFTEHSRSVMWVPHFHDFGMISNIICSFCGYLKLWIMSPLDFIRNPAVWFQVMSDVKATHCAAPPFALGFASRKTTNEQRKNWDLSSLEMLAVAAEPIVPGIVDPFLKQFEAAKLSPSAFCPGYGLAENNITITGGGEKRIKANRRSIEDGNIIIDEENGIELIGCGQINNGLDNHIVDPETHLICKEGIVGEIWSDSPSKSRGYWNRPDINDDVFRAEIKNYPTSNRYLRTGDLGFVYEGELYVTGRIKDVIIINGKNIYPQDIEISVQESHDLVRPGCVIAFGSKVNDEQEELHVVSEVRSKEAIKLNSELSNAIRKNIMKEHNVAVAQIYFIKKRTIPKTTSGKVTRNRCKQWILDGTLDKQILCKSDYLSTINLDEVEVPNLKSTTRETNELRSELAEKITLAIAQELNIDKDSIDVRGEFGQYIIDSIAMVRLSEEFNSLLKLELSPVDFFTYPSIEKLVDYVVANRHEISLSKESVIKLEPPSKDQIQNNTVEKQKVKNNDIAIIGMSGSYPGSPDLASFWENLTENRDLITEIPKSRWDWQNHYGNPKDQMGKTNVKWGGFMEHIDHFDALHFNISPREAEMLDPQHRLTMEHVVLALNDASINPAKLSGSNTGIYMGVSSSDYAYLLSNSTEIFTLPQISTGNAHSMLVNRISYWLNIHGPSEPVDTACSSSLVSICKAVESIKNGDCDVAIAGGVNTIIIPEITIAFSQAGMLSPKGKCHTFDEGADGYVRGEGVGVIILKSLAKAIEDGDRIHSVIKSTVINHG